MDLQSELKKALNIALLDEKVMQSVAADKNLTRFAIGIMLTSALIGAAGNVLFPRFTGFILYRPDWGTALASALGSFVMTVALVYLSAFFAQKFFESKVHGEELLRVSGYGSVVGLLAILPQLSALSSLWNLVIFAVVLKRIAKLEWGAVAIIMVAVFLIAFFLRGMMY